MNPTPSSLRLTLRANPDQVFSEWLSEQKLGDRSRRVYSSMFSKFSRWMDERGAYLELCDDEDIAAFLDGNDLKKHHRYRYVRLLERFYGHLKRELRLTIENPGSVAAREGVGLGLNDAMQFFLKPQYDAVAEHLAAGRGEEKTEKKENKDARDRALASVMLFGALRVGEVALLSVNCISEDGSKINIKRAGRIPEHESLILREGRECILEWLRMRRSAALPTTVLFPANDAGEPMHPASIYRRVRFIIESAFEAAGLDPNHSRLSPQTLRNTYAGILIERGYLDKQIMDSMGLALPRSVAHIRDAYAIATRKTGKTMSGFAALGSTGGGVFPPPPPAMPATSDSRNIIAPA